MVIRPIMRAGAALAVAVGCGLAAPARAAEPGIVVLNVTGSGCRPKTTTAALSPDRTAITLSYSEYLVAAAGSTRTVSRNCRVNLKVNPQPGYAPTITSVDYRGFADLAPGSVVGLSATYGFHGATHIESAGFALTGPFSDDWESTDAAAGGVVTGACNGSNVVDVDSTLSLTSTAAGAPTDFTAMDSADGVVPNTFHLVWRPCS